MTTRVCCKEKKYDVYIGRPSFWGNPYSHKEGTLAEFKVNSRKEANKQYALYLSRSKEHQRRLKELQGQTLGCWCKENESCHGDVLIATVNEWEMEQLLEGFPI